LKNKEEVRKNPVIYFSKLPSAGIAVYKAVVTNFELRWWLPVVKSLIVPY